MSQLDEYDKGSEPIRAFATLVVTLARPATGGRCGVAIALTGRALGRSTERVNMRLTRLTHTWAFPVQAGAASIRPFVKANLLGEVRVGEKSSTVLFVPTTPAP